MNGKLLSAQLSFLPEDMVAEAMEPGNGLRLKHICTRTLRIAACLAVIIGLLLGVPLPNSNDPDTIIGQGLLSVTVYAADQSSSTTLSPDTVLPFDYQWSPAVSSMPGQPITLSVSESDYASKNITFQVTVDGGGFYVGVDEKGYYTSDENSTIFVPGILKAMPKQFTVPNNSTIFWNSTLGATEGDTFFKDGTVAFADIIIFDGEKILGYTVLKFQRESPSCPSFSVSMVESVSLSAKNDAITEQYVQSLIQKAKER